MTALALLAATALVVTGVVAAAGTAVDPWRAVAGVGAGALLLLVADSGSLTAGATTRALSAAGLPLMAGLLVVVMLGLRRAAAVVLLGGVLAGPVRQLFDDPFHDPDCTRSCDPNPLVLAPHLLLADAVHVIGVVVILLGLVGLAAHPGRRPFLAAMVVGMALLSSIAVGIETATLGAALATMVVAVDVSRTMSVRARLNDSVTALATTQDPDLVLSEALGRPVTLAFPLGDRVVDRHGVASTPPRPGDAVVAITGPDGPLAQLRTDLAGLSAATVVHALQGPARLALANTRLAAESAVRTREIQRSAARLVEEAEVGRRTLERDLHDGAQRHVLTLGLALQAEEALPEDVRSSAAEDVRAILDQLRDVAHGIRPPQLDTGGLAGGLAVLADRSPVPLDIATVTADIGGPAAEASYRLVEEVLRTATGPVTVTGDRTADGTLEVIVTVDRGGAVSWRASDQCRALGGSLGSTCVGPGWRHVARLPPRLP